MTTFFHMQWGGAATWWDGVAEAAIFDHFWLWVAAVILCMPLRQTISNLFDRHTANRPHLNQLVGSLTKLVVSAAILLLCTALLVGATNNAFIYTRF